MGNVPKDNKRKGKYMYNRLKTRKNAKKSLLPKKGLNQTSYEKGFFDFLKLFWKRNERMNKFTLVKEVVNLWHQILPKPKFSKKTVIRDYQDEYESLQREMYKTVKTEEMDTNSDEADSVDNSSKTSYDSSDYTEKEKESRTNTEYASSQDEDDKNVTNKNEEENDSQSPNKNVQKRKERKYENYDDYLKNKKNSSVKKQENQENKKEKKQDDQEKNTKSMDIFEDYLQPFEEQKRINHFEKFDLLRKLKICKPCADILQDNDKIDISKNNSKDDVSEKPKKSSKNKTSLTLQLPTNTLIIKNLVKNTGIIGVQEIFKDFLIDIMEIKIIEGEFYDKASVEFNTVQASQRAWRILRDTYILEFDDQII